MKNIFLVSACTFLWLLALSFSVFAQMPQPPTVPIWDANKVTLGLEKLGNDIYAIIPTTAKTETSKGIPHATTGGFVIGDKGVLLIEVMMTRGLFEQQLKLIRSVTDKPIIYAVNTSDHGDHCFSNYLLDKKTVIIQNDFAKENLSKNYPGIKSFMVGLFGAGRGIEDSEYRPADITIPKGGKLEVDMGEGKIVQLLNISPAQSMADLFVWMPNQKIFWAGNPFIAESPAIPWLFDGVFLEPSVNLNKVYDFLPDDAIIIPGHGRITNKAGIKFTIDYVNELQKEVTAAVKKGLTLEQTKKEVTMKAYDKGYVLFNWLHYNFNLPNAYKDISKK